MNIQQNQTSQKNSDMTIHLNMDVCVLSLIKLAENYYPTHVRRSERQWLKKHVLEATGIELKEYRGRIWAYYKDTRLKEVNKFINGSDLVESKVIYDAISKNINLWISDNKDIEFQTKIRVKHGVIDILNEKIPCPNKVLLISYFFYSCWIKFINEEIKLFSGSGVVFIDYISEKIHWTNGILRIKGLEIPQSAKIFLKGKPLSTIIENEVIGNQIIRSVSGYCPKERILRVNTTLEGKTEVYGEEN